MDGAGILESIVAATALENVASAVAQDAIVPCSILCIFNQGVIVSFKL